MNGFEYIENLDNYLSSIEKYRPLTPKEEMEIGKKIANGDKFEINKLINSNLKFVVSVAKQYRGKGVPFDELISEGNMGLITAAMKFDYTKGCKFITYAIYWIRYYINKRITDFNAEKASADIYENLKNSPIEYNEEELILKNVSATTAIDEITSCLKEREKKMLFMYFGINGEKQSDYKELGKQFGVTSECVRQTVNASIAKMKRNSVCLNNFTEYNNAIV